ncbi:tRNA methyltransferase complex GCD14 subunit [Coleophoma crateriformis]|uniref:tRNA (adenine(58)-N(1))-methyltransferase catalytic subunit TRM61 n=1 Tax=Coleophoma crateriformis TaxID=565419 RepID=A0A3D8QE98_9HELO|nr:tRNA methyltransferase complex GCD14 subunit [Coleophoma crateriformis]
MASKLSPFLHAGPVATDDNLSIIHLKRDLQTPTILRSYDKDDEGYSEGKVVNTRFGSFPHKTLIGLPWGSQVRASRVDTGSRGRRQEKKKKRKSDEAGLDASKEEAGDTPKEEKETVTASSGFIHLLPPTPENWTSSLPHRTQVVYTPDYSYILHRIRARPGTNIIEAGAGSGSFTHASARAVYSGLPSTEGGELSVSASKRRKLGKVWSFEFHEQRHEKLVKEIQDHGLEGVVQITHRDVCEDGFLVNEESPKADAIFLDLPAPWLALPHLSRSGPPAKEEKEDAESNGMDSSKGKPFVSPLNPTVPVHLCTFSPCIEQVQRTVSVMRHLGWTDISMVEVAQKRIEVRRERVGIDNGQQRGIQATPANVDEALARLKEVEGNFQTFHGQEPTGETTKPKKVKREQNPNNRETIMESLVERKVYKEGRLVHKTEPDVKTHTSYLVFAILPVQWTAEDEEKVRAKWAIKVRKTGDQEVDGEVVGVSRRQQKKAARQAMKDNAAAKKEASLSAPPSEDENKDLIADLEKTLEV